MEAFERTLLDNLTHVVTYVENGSRLFIFYHTFALYNNELYLKAQTKTKIYREIDALNGSFLNAILILYLILNLIFCCQKRENKKNK